MKKKIRQLIAIHERNLSLLEQQRTVSEPHIPVHLVNSIKHEKTEIAKLQTELEELQRGEVRELPEEVYAVYLKAKQELKDLRQKLESLPEALDDLSRGQKWDAGASWRHSHVGTWERDETRENRTSSPMFLPVPLNSSTQTSNNRSS